MESGGFHGIQRDFMKSGGFHDKDLYICIGSDEKYSLVVVDHEIPADFMHEIWWIS